MLCSLQVHSRLCCACPQLLLSCPALCDPTACIPPGSSVHGVLQGGILEWVAMPSSMGSSWPGFYIYFFRFFSIVGDYEILSIVPWCWSSNTLATWCEELTHWKRPWWWERLKAGGDGDDRGWDGWMASLTQWTWVWASSGKWWRTGKPEVLQSMASQRVNLDWATEQQQQKKALLLVPKISRTGASVRSENWRINDIEIAVEAMKMSKE